MLPNKYDSDSSMGNDGNEACDTRLTLGLATSDHHKNVTCLDLSIVPLHFSDHGTNKINGSSSKTCKSYSKFTSDHHKNVTCLDLSIVPLHSSDHGTNKINGSSSKTCKSCSKFNSESKKIGMSKKLRLTKEQSTLLEDSFKHHTTLAMGQKQELAAKLKLKPRQVEVWFQNRRARIKLKQTEEDCEFLKKWCQSLNDENNRLKKELQEIRPIKIDQRATPFHLSKPRTLTLCSSCQKISRDYTDEKHEIGPESG